MQSKVLFAGRWLIASALLAFLAAPALAQRGDGRGGDVGRGGNGTTRGGGGWQGSDRGNAPSGLWQGRGQAGERQRGGESARSTIGRDFSPRDFTGNTATRLWQGEDTREGFTGERESRYWDSGRGEGGRARVDWDRDDWVSDRGRGDWNRGWGWGPGIGWRAGYGRPGYGYGDYRYYGPGYGYDESYAVAPGYGLDMGQSGAEGDYMDQAVAAFQQGDYRTALRMASHAEVDNPRDPQVHLLAALAMLALNDYRGGAMQAHAVAAFGSLPDWDVVYSFYGNIQPYTQQLRALERFVRNNPSARDARFLLGFLYLISEYREAAAREFLAALQQAPRDRLAARLLRQAGGTVPADIAAQQRAQRPAPGGMQPSIEEQPQPQSPQQQGQPQQGQPQGQQGQPQGQQGQRGPAPSDSQPPQGQPQQDQGQSGQTKGGVNQ